jgi:hypothetical protein
MAHKVPENLNYVCSRVQKLFTSFASNPQSIQHLLLYGSPGSGKTSSTLWLLKKIWPEDQLFSRVCFILNAADERSLEAIRAKCIPFIEVDWRSKGEVRPRFLVLDECETLTESAQLALRPFLDNPPSSLCVIFLCNSLNRVHQTIRNACLRVRFNPPLPLKSSFSSIFYRGDLRQSLAGGTGLTQPFSERMSLAQAQPGLGKPTSLASLAGGTSPIQDELNVTHKPTFNYIHRYLNYEKFMEYSSEEFISSLIFFIIFTDLIDDDICNFVRCYGENQVFDYISLDQSKNVFKDFLKEKLMPKIDSFNWTEEDSVVE